MAQPKSPIAKLSLADTAVPEVKVLVAESATSQMKSSTISGTLESSKAPAVQSTAPNKTPTGPPQQKVISNCDGNE